MMWEYSTMVVKIWTENFCFQRCCLSFSRYIPIQDPISFEIELCWTSCVFSRVALQIPSATSLSAYVLVFNFLDRFCDMLQKFFFIDLNIFWSVCTAKLLSSRRIFCPVNFRIFAMEKLARKLKIGWFLRS